MRYFKSKRDTRAPTILKLLLKTKIHIKETHVQIWCLVSNMDKKIHILIQAPFPFISHPYVREIDKFFYHMYVM